MSIREIYFYAPEAWTSETLTAELSNWLGSHPARLGQVVSVEGPRVVVRALQPGPVNGTYCQTVEHTVRVVAERLREVGS